MRRHLGQQGLEQCKRLIQTTTSRSLCKPLESNSFPIQSVASYSLLIRRGDGPALGYCPDSVSNSPTKVSEHQGNREQKFLTRGHPALQLQHHQSRWQLPWTSQTPCQHRSLSSAADSKEIRDVKDKIVVVELPQMSPHMRDGKIRKWLKQPGEAVSMYDVIFEVDTENLSEEAYKVGDFAGNVTMLVEAQEEGVLSQILVPEGQLVNVHTPVAVMCDTDEEATQLKNVEEVVRETVRHSRDSLRSLTWQCYLKESTEGQKGCS